MRFLSTQEWRARQENDYNLFDYLLSPSPRGRCQFSARKLTEGVIWLHIFLNNHDAIPALPTGRQAPQEWRTRLVAHKPWCPKNGMSNKGKEYILICNPLLPFPRGAAGGWGVHFTAYLKNNLYHAIPVLPRQAGSTGMTNWRIEYRSFQQSPPPFFKGCTTSGVRPVAHGLWETQRGFI